MRVLPATIDKETQDHWILGGNVPGVTYRMCQVVTVVSGPARGSRGELISLIAISPVPAYHLETQDGGDEQVLQTELAAIHDA